MMPTKITQAFNVNGQCLTVELSDGRTLALTLPELLSMDPYVVPDDEDVAYPTPSPLTKQPASGWSKPGMR
jgi:hypothetical protein